MLAAMQMLYSIVYATSAVPTPAPRAAGHTETAAQTESQAEVSRRAVASTNRRALV